MKNARIILGVLLAGAVGFAALAMNSGNPSGSTVSATGWNGGSASAPGIVALAPQAVTLLNGVSADVTGAQQVMVAGNYAPGSAGTWGGATVTLYEIVDGGAPQAIPGAVFTAAPAAGLCYTVAAGTVIYATVTGGPPTGLTFSLAPQTQPCAALPPGAAQDGTDATGVTPPSGGVGIRGWLSGIYADILALLNSVGDVNGASQTLNSATLNAALTLPLSYARATVAFTISGLTASGATLTLEYSNDGTHWVAKGIPGLGQASAITADGSYRVNVAGHEDLRWRVSVVGTGTITISYDATQAAGDVNATIVPPSAAMSQYAPQTPSPTSPVTIPANTATVVFNADPLARELDISAVQSVGGAPNLSCTLSDNGSQIALIGGQFDFNQFSDPVPNSAVTMTCLSAGYALIWMEH